MHIHRAGNTEIPAFLSLEAKGFIVSWKHRKVTQPNQRKVEFIATKGEHSFSAYSVVELLGLVAIWETRGDDWRKRENEPNPLEDLINLLNNES
jgi:hypothetical protein